VRRPTVRIAAVLAAAFLALAGLGVASFVGLARGDADGGRFRGSAPPVGVELPAFALRNYTGAVVRRNDLEGKVVVVTFLETKCREACPLIAGYVGEAAERLSTEARQRTRFLAISTHPGDDTPASVRRFLTDHRALGKLDYLIGSERELRPVWNEFAVVSALDSGDADTHSASVRVFDPTGTWVSSLRTGVDLTADNLAHDVQAASQP
jgi:cytochrome oxidase Cu insertion factor (SCO1/SenC/PrrC family)